MSTTTPVSDLERPIAITMGDAAGIGPELCVRLLSQAQEVPGIIYGDLVSLQRALALTDLDQVYRLVAISHPIQYARISIVENQIPVLQCRSEEHTSELQSRFDLVCRLLLEKKTHQAP